ncbi:Hsp20/alpha crystallin family protein [Cyanobium sp. FGCU-52]|nr:Hsp20/alpha crystallin family protein [Cyanobium sp. FGCU52]
MTLMNALESLQDLEKMIDRPAIPFRWPLARPASLMTMELNPRVDISEDDGSYRIHADVPGLRREDLRVSLADGVLTIEGERKEEKLQESTLMHRLERFHGRFRRSFTLPADADPSGLKARCQDGQLTVTVPRKATVAPEAAVTVPVE